VGRDSNCWSVGQPDVDCIDTALCCFDGCANVCQGQGSRPNIPLPKSNARGQQRNPPRQSNPKAQGNQQKGVNPQKTKKKQNQAPINPVQQQTVKGPKSNTRPGYGNGGRKSSPPRKSNTVKNPNQTSKQGVPGVGGGLLFPLVSKADLDTDTESSKTHAAAEEEVSQGKPTNNGQPSPTFVSPSQVKSSQPQPQAQPRRPKPTNVFQQSAGAATKPYIRCPSAMNCVQKVNCDFEGFITEELFDLSPELDMLRVPLIVSLLYTGFLK